jgi:hypothetical protein
MKFKICGMKFKTNVRSRSRSRRRRNANIREVNGEEDVNLIDFSDESDCEEEELNGEHNFKVIEVFIPEEK